MPANLRLLPYCLELEPVERDGGLFKTDFANRLYIRRCATWKIISSRDVYHRHIQIGLVALHPVLVWRHFGSWLRTGRFLHRPSEFVAACALRHSLQEFVAASLQDSSFELFLATALISSASRTFASPPSPSIPSRTRHSSYLQTRYYSFIFA